MKRAIMRAILITFGVVSAMIVTELGLRMYYPDGSIPAAHLESTSDEEHTTFHEDPECGYLPIVSVGDYGPHGCVLNDYDVAKKTAPRILFVGDSVTHRARIIEALKQLYGADTFEYWNAGVESFNTKQEAVLYRKHNFAIKPDHVVLTFHNNDFRATPIVVRERGQIKVYLPGLNVNPWLFRKSYLYRWAWPRAEDKSERQKQVLEGLTEFKELLAKDNIGLSVVLHPMLKPVADWDQNELQSRELSLQYFKQLDLKVYDLLPALESALAEGLEVVEAPGDTLHPNDAMAQRFAKLLKEQGLLDASSSNVSTKP